MEETTRLKRKRVSKNKKKSWRKHTDITDVEEALDDERLQQRTGGLVAEKPDGSLFFVDKSTEEDGVVNKRRRSLRCYANLEPDLTTVPAIIKRSAQTSKKVKKKAVVTDRKTKKQTIAEEQRRKAVRQRKLRQSTSEALPVSSYDLWSDKKNPDREAVDSFYLEYTKKKRVQTPRHYHEKTSALAAVAVPHPGASYNPAYDDHQALLTTALDVELAKARKERRILKSLDEKFPSRDEAPTENTWLEEMSAGLFEADEAPEGGDLSDDGERLSVNPAVRREGKKTLRQRRIEKERKAKEKAQHEEKAKKNRKHELFRLKSIKAEVKAREAALLKRQARKAELKILYKDKPKKLGKHRYEEPEIEIKLSDELKGSLRELKPEGHLLEDRFKTLQRRNVIETRKRAKFVRKYKRKKFEKKGHKAVTKTMGQIFMRVGIQGVRITEDNGHR